jgi:hypothetical protein
MGNIFDCRDKEDTQQIKQDLLYQKQKEIAYKNEIEKQKKYNELEQERCALKKAQQLSQESFIREQRIRNDYLLSQQLHMSESDDRYQMVEQMDMDREMFIEAQKNYQNSLAGHFENTKIVWPSNKPKENNVQKSKFLEALETRQKNKPKKVPRESTRLLSSSCRSYGIDPADYN